MSKFVLVETLSQFRMRYVIEVPDNHNEVNENQFGCSAITWAEDTVTMEQAREFSQKWIGEPIIGSREVTKEEILQLVNEDNDYCNGKYSTPWSDEKKLKTFVTEIGYKRDW